MKYAIFYISFFVTVFSAQAQEGSLEQFDFWLGEWNVYNYGTETLVGYSRIERELSGHAIHEHYQSARGSYYGESFNTFNPVLDKWEQHWIDNSGTVLNISGNRIDDQMILSSCVDTICNKIAWTDLKNETVRQEWYQKTSSSEEWKKIFDGHYKKRYAGEVQPALSGLNAFHNIRDFTISNNSKEAYITMQDDGSDNRKIIRLTIKDGAIRSQRIASFSGIYRDLEPFLSPDQHTLYFASDRPLDSTRMDYNIWRVTRSHIDSMWSDPEPLSPEINTTGPEFYPSITSDGVLYFTAVRPEDNGKDNIYTCNLNKSPLVVKPLPEAINTAGYEFNAFIAPDESYIIFSGYNRPDGLGSGDLYISRMDDDGEWKSAEHLGATVNSKQMDYCPFVLQDTLYFTSKRLNTEGVKKDNIQQYMFDVKGPFSGSSYIYKTVLPD